MLFLIYVAGLTGKIFFITFLLRAGGNRSVTYFFTNKEMRTNTLSQVTSVCRTCGYQGLRHVSFSENVTYVLNE